MCLSSVAGLPGFCPWGFGEPNFFFGKRNHFRVPYYKDQNAYM